MNRPSTFEARYKGNVYGAEAVSDNTIELRTTISGDGTEKALPEPITLERLALTSITFNEGPAKNAVGTRLSTPVS